MVQFPLIDSRKRSVLMNFETILHKRCSGIFRKRKFTSATSRSYVFFAISWTFASKIVSFGEPQDARQLPCLTELACKQKTIFILSKLNFGNLTFCQANKTKHFILSTCHACLVPSRSRSLSGRYLS